MRFTDSHCHLDFAEFDQNRTQLLNQCYQQNIRRIVIPSIAPSNWQQVLALATPDNQENKQPSSPTLFPCLGIHPWFLNDLSESVLEQLNQLISQHKNEIIAVGEAGIDGAIAKQQGNLTKQQVFFEYQLMLAKQHDLPIVVHHRQSHQWLAPALKIAHLARGGVIHAFSGSYQQAKQYLDLGFKLGIGGTISYERAQKTIKTVKKLPLDCLVLETDAPSMPLAGYQGQANSPIRLIDVFSHLCQTKQLPSEMVAEQLEHNIDQLFFDSTSR
ncbi:TatD family hydrolase [Endozoicomonas sp. G2_1]|uniref:TatD family hydrolase n=1 Tax=Endozoicomonas sp. G2_1 TaxID=2821091 RepID=UPI001ADC7C62|nr:TatD family hydrolase [Endozoicomonas sp. G2_1]MBO9490175.1 TatD family hydrolase [Endozoicomonas sp. G2_1]